MDAGTRAALRAIEALRGVSGDHGLGVCDLDTSAKIPTARLGTGTADSTVFLRGDRAWATTGGGAPAETFVSKAKWMDF